MAHVSGQLKDRETVTRVAEGLESLDLRNLHRLDIALGAIPLHELPHSLVALTMIVAATVREFTERIELACRMHRQMDAANFNDFFRALSDLVECACEAPGEISKKAREYEDARA